jgi:hypothetical protein
MKRTVVLTSIFVLVFGFTSLACAQTKNVRIKKENHPHKDKKSEKQNNPESDRIQSEENKTNTSKTNEKIVPNTKQTTPRRESQLCRQIYNIYSAIGF